MRNFLPGLALIFFVGCTHAPSTPSEPAGRVPSSVATEIEPALLHNDNLFQNDFFRKFRLQHAPAPLRLNEEIEKDYWFPTLYGNVATSVALFFCDYDAAQKLMPDSTMRPVRMARGRSLLVITTYRYNTVLGMHPYNEVAISIPVLNDPLINVPVLPILMSSYYPGLGYYVLSMPVTSLENQIRGLKIWGLPKELQDIRFSKDGGVHSTEVFENGSPYLKLSVPMAAGKNKKMHMESTIYSRLDGRWLEATSESQGEFNVQNFSRALVEKNRKPAMTYLEISGDSSSARILRSLKIEPQPFQTRYAEGVSSAFEYPHEAK